MFSFLKKKRIYLDHAATTPLDKDVLCVMNEVYNNNYFNPGGLYLEGVLAAQKITECRKSVANLLGTTSNHIVFTRGGTESNNMAILGVLEKYFQNNSHKVPHVIVSSIEHVAVLETVKFLEKTGKITLSLVSVDEQGIVDVKEFKKLLRTETVLVSIMYVNNEIGSIQSIKEITKLIRWFKKHNDLKTYPLFHTDAIQAVNYLDLNVERLGVDLMSLSGSKIYGPKSSGVLYVRNRDLISSMFHGGDQEFDLRAGTEDTASVVGFTKALAITREISEKETRRLAELQEYFFGELVKNIPDIIMNGGIDRICNNINITIPGISGERLVIELDAQGICASSKSACAENSGELSHVITAIKPNSSLIDGSVRFTMGRATSKVDIVKVIRIFSKIILNIRVFEKNLTR